MPSFDPKNPVHIAAAVALVIAIVVIVKFVIGVAAMILTILFWGAVIVGGLVLLVYLLGKSRSGS